MPNIDSGFRYTKYHLHRSLQYAGILSIAPWYAAKLYTHAKDLRRNLN